MGNIVLGICAIESMQFFADAFDTALLAKENISAHGVSNITQ
jgi:hypothetical protein